jgi:DNA-binding transcriptional ArsR family regulator
MEKNEENNPVEISERVEILSTEDEKIKKIGEILSSDSSREILKILFNDAMTANQISQKTGISLPLVIYHLKKMQESKMIKIANVGKNTKSHDMKFYTVDKLAIVILPSNMSAPAKKSKSLLNSFTRIHRLATLGGISLAAWFSSQLIQKGTDVSNMTQSPPIMDTVPPELPEMALKAAPLQESGSNVPSTLQLVQGGDPQVQLLWSIVTVLSVIVVGLTIEMLISKKQSKKLIN